MIVRDADPDAIDAAARLLRAGALVAFPTETVYGLGADASDPDALAGIFAAKGRPADHPLIVHLGGVAALRVHSPAANAAAQRLAEAFWPGPLTLVVPLGPGISPAATGGRPSVGLRVPDHPVALELLARAGRPLAAPSANRFGRVSPTCAADVAAEFRDAPLRPELILDGGACRVGVESTIVELLGPTPVLLRPGGVPAEFIEDVLGVALAPAAGPARASGMLASHYAPTALIDLVECAGAAGALATIVAGHLAGGARVAVLAAPGHMVSALPAEVLALGAGCDLDDYAHGLFRWLRDADEAGVDRVVAVLPAATGIGRAVRDRLHKAAAPRHP